MELLELNTKDEQISFFNLTAKSSDMLTSNYYHIGAQVFNGFWRWLVSRNLLDYDMDWYPGEPNNSGVSKNSEKCLSIYKDSKSLVGFNDIRCDKSKCFFLCQTVQKREVSTKASVMETSGLSISETSVIFNQTDQELSLPISQEITTVNSSPTLTPTETVLIEISSEVTSDSNSTENEVSKNPNFAIISKNTTTTYNSTSSNVQTVSFTSTNSTTVNGTTLTHQFSNSSNVSHQSNNLTVINETSFQKIP